MEGRGNRWLLEDGRRCLSPEHDMQLTLRDKQTVTTHKVPARNIDLVRQHNSTPYFRPQATLDYPLDVDLYQQEQNRRSINAKRNDNTSMTLFRPPTGMSKDEQLALVLSDHPDLDFDDALKMIEGSNDDTEIVIHKPTKNSSASLAVGRPIHLHSKAPQDSQNMPLDQKEAVSESDEEQEGTLVQVNPLQRGDGARSVKTIKSHRSASITPSESASQIWPRNTPGEQKEVDLHSALTLSRGPPDQSAQKYVDVSPQSRLLQRGEPRGRAFESHMSSNTHPVPVEYRQSQINVQVSNPAHILDRTSFTPQPLFDDSATVSLVGRHSTQLYHQNTNTDIQRLADTAAIHNLSASRGAARSQVESNMLSALNTIPSSNRSTTASLALAHENLLDSRLSTALTAKALSDQRIAALSQLDQENEIAHLQGLANAEARRRLHLIEDNTQKTEAKYRAQMRDRQRQREKDEAREQEEADRRYAMQLDQQQHEQLLEKVDAFDHSVNKSNKPSRRHHHHRPQPESVIMSSITGSEDGPGFTQIQYSNGLDDDDLNQHNDDDDEPSKWTKSDEDHALGRWEEFEKRGGKPGNMRPEGYTELKDVKKGPKKKQKSIKGWRR